MLVNILMSLAKIVLPVLIDKIFDAEETYPAPMSGNVKREVVHKAITLLIDEHLIPDFNGSKLGDLIDAQVKILKDNNLAWSAGAEVIKTILNNIVEIEENDPDHDNKLWYVVDKTLQAINEDVDPGFDEDAIAGFIQAQVSLFDDFGIFDKREKK